VGYLNSGGAFLVFALLHFGLLLPQTLLLLFMDRFRRRFYLLGEAEEGVDAFAGESTTPGAL
jgi:hypothetical protein